MNILIKISTLLLFMAIVNAPLNAQKKLALANECFNAEAYYLASKYYQQAFDKFNDCHPDQVKLAQSLAATKQPVAAETVFQKYLRCQKYSPDAQLAYGKFLMDIQAYERAIPYFEKAIEAEPQLARHYILACQMALPKAPEEASRVFVSQVTASNLPEPNVNEDKQEATIVSMAKKEPADPVTKATNDINLYEAMTSANKAIPEQTRTTVSKTSSENIVIVKEKEKVVEKGKVVLAEAEKEASPYGVRLGTYQPAKVPSLSAIAHYGKIDQKQWNGKTIIYLVDFNSRAAAEAALKLVLQQNFRSATLVEKLASGRMKSIR